MFIDAKKGHNSVPKKQVNLIRSKDVFFRSMAFSTATQSIRQILERYWGLIVLLAWGGALLSLGLLRTTPYGLDEGAARGLLLIWSIFDKIINPIVTLGIPDFRALLFIPLGAYWPGSLIAAKVFTLALAFAAATLLYRWSSRTADTEAALVASALLLISPQFINEIDSIDTGVYLLLAFALGAWLNGAYRRSQRAFSGWFFMQLLWVGITITLHPAGLAYPLILAWTWHKDPLDPQRKRHLWMGLVLVTAVTLAIRGGWTTIEWGINPLMSLAQAHQSVIGIAEPNWLIGGLFAALLALVAWIDRRFLTSDFLGLLLFAGVVIGLASADSAWVILALVLVLYRGTPHLIALNQKISGNGLLQQRGLVFAVGFILATTFMMTDKARHQAIALGTLNPQDQLIQFLAQEIPESDKTFRAASQWPGRTMIAVRRDVFPLPKAAADGPTLLRQITGITHLVFDHNDIKNRDLSRNIAELGGATETLFLDRGGVVVQIRSTAPDTSHEEGNTSPAPAPTAPPQDPSARPQ